MKINLGEKIRELRKSTGRKQEDLAKALGVTAQAVSRWEADGGYPDMSMIPSIANYFHITIDELFGYNSDREAKKKSYLIKADELLLKGGSDDLTECIRLLRKGLEEFPSEPQLQLYLAHALNNKGFRENNTSNIYWEEAVSLYEELSKQNIDVIDSEQKSDVISQLLSLYSLMKKYDKAEKKAIEQPGIRQSREVLLSKIFDDKKGAKYHGEAILALLHELSVTMDSAIAGNAEIANDEEGIEILLLLRQLYEKILGREFQGRFHSDLILIDLRCARIAADMRNYKKMLEFFDSAYDQFEKTESDKRGYSTEDHYESPLLTEVGNTSIPVVYWKKEVFRHYLSLLPEEAAGQIKSNQKYKVLY